VSVADADKNGSVTKDEIKAAVAAGTLKFPHGGYGHHGPRGDGERGPDGDSAPPPATDAAPSGT
jgi:hypothetical protein